MHAFDVVSSPTADVSWRSPRVRAVGRVVTCHATTGPGGPANDVDSAEKQSEIFLSTCGAHTYQL